MQKAAAPLLIIIIIGAVYAVFVQYKNLNQGSEATPLPMQKLGGKMMGAADRGPMGGGPMGGNKAQVLGNKKAKIVVDAILPLGVECHAKTIQLLQDFVKKNPDKVCVNIYDLHSMAGEQAKGKFGVTCATVLINGKQEFDIQENGKGRHVLFSHKPNEPGASYNSEDVLTVLKQEVGKTATAKS